MKCGKVFGLKVISALSAAGLLFSGYLTYNEFFGTCTLGCGLPSNTILGLPACVYGFAMYLIIFAVALCSLKSEEK